MSALYGAYKVNEVGHPPAMGGLVGGSPSPSDIIVVRGKAHPGAPEMVYMIDPKYLKLAEPMPRVDFSDS